MKKIIFFLLLAFSTIVPESANAIVSHTSETATHATITPEKKKEYKKNGLWGGLIGIVCLAIGFVVATPVLQIAFLGTGVVMCLIGAVFLIKSLQ